MKIDIISI